MPVRRDGSDLERQSGLGVDLQVQIDEPGRGTLERSTQPPQLGIVGLPNSLTRLEPFQVDRGAAEAELDAAGPRHQDLVDTPALFGNARRIVAIEDDAIARLDDRGAGDHDPCNGNRLNAAKEDPALLGVVATHQHLVVVAVEEAVAEPAGERELHLLDIARGERDRPPGPGRVDGLAIMPGDVGHVLRRLEAALDLQAGDARSISRGIRS